MKTNYLLSLACLLPFGLEANTPEPTSALAYQQMTTTRIVVEENHLRFFTGGSERMTIDANGNVGIGNTTPNTLLDLKQEGSDFIDMNRVSANSAYRLAISSTGRFSIYDVTNATERLSLTSNGNVGIGTTSPGDYKLFVNGSVLSNSFMDIGYARPTDARKESLYLNPSDGSYNTNFEFATKGWAGSHAILFNAYKSNSQVNGGLATVGNTKYTHDVTQYGSGAASIMYFGNGGKMYFFISPASTGSGTDVNWGTSKMVLQRDGTVGINTNDPNENYKLHVNGRVYATEYWAGSDQKVWPDYVFDKEYELKDLREVEQFIETNHHLPEIPSAAEIEKEGIELVDMQAKLLQKIEELTLYVIEQQKEINELKSKINSK